MTSMHLATGDIPVQRSRLPEDGPTSVDETVKIMAKMAKGEYGSRSAKIRALAINIINAANVPDKDYYRMAKAIHEWVRDQIRYIKDPIGDGDDGETLNQETLSYPEETAFNSKAGDCLDGDTRLLTPMGYKAIRDVREGDVIQGKSGWTKVLRWFDKGELPTFRVLLDNGAHFHATGEHRCFLLEGDETTVSELSEDDALLGPSNVKLPESSDFLTDEDYHFVGLYLADGWCDANRACISGKDGFAKEAQKHWVKAWAEKKGWETSWHPRYIRVYIPKDHTLFDLVHDGKLAPEKEIPNIILSNLTTNKATRLLEGLLADYHHPLRSQRVIGSELQRKRRTRSGGCYSTTSHELAKQMRLLFRLQGVSVRDTLVVDHGGLGDHPVHRIYPRYFRDKPARVDAVELDEIRHVYDITTEDHGIYLPDADVVVHNCDDKTILEIALLGSLGLQSYPVVIGTVPGRYNHVYLNIVLPPGKYAHAGETIPADPIMREWPLGKEAPAYKVKMKKLYTDLSGLGTMDLGAYASAPAYIDHRNVPSVGPVLRNKMTDTGSRGQLMNVNQVLRPSEDLDDMFVRGIQDPTQPAQLRTLWNRGPVTAHREAKLTSYLHTDGAVKIPRRAGSKLVEVTESQWTKDPLKDTGPTVGELVGLADCISSIENEMDGCAGFLGVAGPNDPIHRAAAASAYAHSRAAKATKRVNYMLRGAGMFGLGEEQYQGVLGAQQVEALAHTVAKKADLVAAKTATSPQRKAALQQDYAKLKALDQAFAVPAVIAKMPRKGHHIHDAQIKVRTLAAMMHSGKAVQWAHNTLVDRGARALPGMPLKTPLPNAVARDQFGRVIYGKDLAGLGYVDGAKAGKIGKAFARPIGIAVARVHEELAGGLGLHMPSFRHIAASFGPVTPKNIFNKMLNPVEQLKTPMRAVRAATSTLPSGAQKAISAMMNPFKTMIAPLTMRKLIAKDLRKLSIKDKARAPGGAQPQPQPGDCNTPDQWGNYPVGCNEIPPQPDPTIDPSTGLPWGQVPGGGDGSGGGGGMPYQPGTLSPSDPNAQMNYPDPFMDQDGMGPAQSDDFPQDADAEGPMPGSSDNIAQPGAMGPTDFDPGMDTGPQDSFGPEDMGPMTSEGGTTFSPDSADDDATEGTAPKRQKRRRRAAPEADTEEEGYEEDSDFVDEGAVDSSRSPSFNQESRPWGIDGLGALPGGTSLVTLGLVGLGAYLLFCKRK